MLEIIRKTGRLIDRRDRSKVIILMVLMIFTAFMQTAGVASVMPFLAVLSEPEMVYTNSTLHWLFEWLGFESTSNFLYFLGVAAFVVFLTGTALQALTHWAITRFSHLQQYELSRRLMGDYLRRPYTFFLSRNSGDLAKTILQETNHATNGAIMPLMRLLSQALLAIFIIILLIVVNPLLAVTVALSLGGIYGAIYLIARGWLGRIGKDRVEANRQRFTAAAEAFAGAKEIRLLGRERDYLERYREPSKRFALHQANATLLQSMPQYAIEAIAFGGVLLLVLFLMAGDGGLNQALPLIGLYALAGRQLIPAFQKIFTTIATLRFSAAAVDSVLRDLGHQPDSSPLPSRTRAAIPLEPQKSIRMTEVTYRYPGFEKIAIHRLSLEIRANTTVGFIGSSGAGKSTLVDLLLGLLTPESGEIKIDDTRLDERNIRNWQAAIGYVPQHIFLADQSVAANIALGVPEDEIDHAAVEEAARLANLHHFVTEELRDGYDTIIGERGTRLSGGQRQRIGIARALYRDPAVLFFDEATSALDNATEQAVMEAIHNLAGNKTILLVAHRLSTVKPCNRIYVLNRGQIVAQGDWDELSSNPDFQKLSSGAA
ncbi:ABC transporter ATP-binding protein [Ectothiorhodospira variabilis]|uniref:ABC transporter ATP-binding protein n=1 Tax=Ectothiorhodospira variabilis TaxID=505694 RepID=UPI001EFB616C|nr:ABC transporter ATP-binding protein [Ectothiorhodospira variabilis]MCG5495338.1 ABC transporter ATP-binding protein/permease [Ectothiorhodospira variabilis]MCG5504936.1 ABC transporter ATP-binding protein/permease [Ectothiorhodospira variabilis]MCG5508093.1 ABC transporter ATP-binding protein/permease [Ectothiorhodospira variabilis]